MTLTEKILARASGKTKVEAGDNIWVQADVPVGAVDARMVDRVLGLVVEGALAARQAMAARPEAPGEPGEGWGALR